MSRSGQTATPPSAILLDVGGVLLLLRADDIVRGLRGWGASASGDDDHELHYRSLAAFDRSGDLLDYRRSYAGLVGVAHDRIEEAARDGAAEALADLVANGMVLVVVSDSDGTVERQLVDAGLCQVGPGPATSLAAVCDSTHVGARKPDRRMFDAGTAAAGVDPRRTVHIGDSLVCDVDGARACGIRAVPVDPLSLCDRNDHDHVVRVAELPALLLLGGTADA